MREHDTEVNFVEIYEKFISNTELLEQKVVNALLYYSPGYEDVFYG